MKKGTHIHAAKKFHDIFWYHDMLSSELEQLSLYTDRRTGHDSPTDAVATTQTLPDDRLL